MLSDLHVLTPDPDALQEVIMANLGEPLELGSAGSVYLGCDEDQTQYDEPKYHG